MLFIKLDGYKLTLCPLKFTVAILKLKGIYKKFKNYFFQGLDRQTQALVYNTISPKANTMEQEFQVYKVKIYIFTLYCR